MFLSQVSHLFNKCTGLCPYPYYKFSDKDITHNGQVPFFVLKAAPELDIGNRFPRISKAKRNNPWSCFPTQPRVISVHSWYLTSFLFSSLSFNSVSFISSKNLFRRLWLLKIFALSLFRYYHHNQKIEIGEFNFSLDCTSFVISL